MQVHYFPNGGFVAHRVYITESTCKFSLWSDSAGNLTAAARYDRLHREFPINHASLAWISLESVARRIAATASK